MNNNNNNNHNYDILTPVGWPEVIND